jgi:hypothetical protein
MNKNWTSEKSEFPTKKVFVDSRYLSGTTLADEFPLNTAVDYNLMKEWWNDLTGEIL